MTNKELLEFAAKAAGYKIGVVPSYQRNTEGFDLHWSHTQECFLVHGTDVGTEWAEEQIWNPLQFDNDAFRLAVKLGFCVSQWPRHTPPDVMVGYLKNTDNGSNWIEEYGDDPYAATRRAIVRAAAEIGKNL